MRNKIADLLRRNKILRYSVAGFMVVFFYLMFIFFAPNILPTEGDESYLKIKDNSNFENVLDDLYHQSHFLSAFTFKQTAFLLHYGDKIHPGRYKITRLMTNFQMIRILRSGRQTPVKLTFNNLRTKQELAGRLSSQLMADSAGIVKLLNDTAFLLKYELTPENSVAIFIPNTYEVYWDLDSMEIFERMYKEYNKFWTDERKAKAAAIPLSQTEVSTLASIVEEESNSNAERPAIAGLYLNRMKKDMPLQADPTVKFAVGDFTLKRINNSHTSVRSPYNTYINKGLPPGPIRIASKQGIDAVLNYEKHNYIFMCAKETFNGEHNFAATWAEHMQNAHKYQEALNKLNIH